MTAFHFSLHFQLSGERKSSAYPYLCKHLFLISELSSLEIIFKSRTGQAFHFRQIKARHSKPSSFQSEMSQSNHRPAVHLELCAAHGRNLVFQQSLLSCVSKNDHCSSPLLQLTVYLSDQQRYCFGSISVLL